MPTTDKEPRTSRTIAVPASIYEAAKGAAHDQRISLNEFIVQAIQRSLAPEQRKKTA